MVITRLIVVFLQCQRHLGALNVDVTDFKDLKHREADFGTFGRNLLETETPKREKQKEERERKAPDWSLHLYESGFPFSLSFSSVLLSFSLFPSFPPLTLSIFLSFCVFVSIALSNEVVKQEGLDW